jgi:hypothetical protein
MNSSNSLAAWVSCIPSLQANEHTRMPCYTDLLRRFDAHSASVHSCFPLVQIWLVMLAAPQLGGHFEDGTWLPFLVRLGQTPEP